MIATRDSTVLAVMSRAARIGRSTEIARGTSDETRCAWEPRTRPNTTKIKTGIPTEPRTPSGSRMKILTSSQVSFQSPRSMVSTALGSADSVPNHVACELEEDVLERRDLRAEVDDRDPMFRETLDDLRHQVAPLAPNRHLRSLAAHRLHLRNGAKPLGCARVLTHQDDRALGAVSSHEVGRSADVDDSAAIDDRD